MDPDLVKRLLDQGENINCVSSSGRSACLSGSFDCVKILISEGADLNLTGEKGWSALMFAIINRRQEISSFLIEHGADMDVLYKNSEVCLHKLSEEERKDMGEFLF